MSDDIADELRGWGNSRENWNAYEFKLGNRAAGRIESLQAELAEARAVIEQVGAEATRHSEVVDGCVRVETAYVTQVLSAYRAAPSSALDAVCPNCSVKPARCCPIHGLHSMPHRGCFLR